MRLIRKLPGWCWGWLGLLVLVLGLHWRPAESVTAEPVNIPAAQLDQAAQDAARTYKTSRKEPLDTALARQIIQAADRYNIGRTMAFRLIELESGFDSMAVSPTRARGLMQVLLSTARDLRPGTKPAELFEVELNLDLGMRYLAILHKRYQGDDWLALVAYNAGMASADSLRVRYGYAHKLHRHR